MDCIIASNSELRTNDTSVAFSLGYSNGVILGGGNVETRSYSGSSKGENLSNILKDSCINKTMAIEKTMINRSTRLLRNFPVNHAVLNLFNCCFIRFVSDMVVGECHRVIDDSKSF